ncbi:hypothetical protein BDZ91DRAFT_722149 [Kalaharituber pfeilii]|nr:hypothetical protein BDZ91DRAFT_722149 [Kalaharituber pfeilii]
MDSPLHCDSAFGADRNDFITFVLSNKHYTPQDFAKLNASLSNHPGAMALLLSSDVNRAFFISDFSERSQRILTWLQYIANTSSATRNSLLASVNKDIIHHFAAGIVYPLLEPDHSDLYPLRGFTDLLVSTIHLSYVYRNRGLGAKTHKVLLEKIARSSYLIRRILPSIEGAKLLQTILAESQAGAETRSFGSVTILTEWTKTAADLCEKCRANHFVNEQLGRWTSLLELQDSLHRILRDAEENRRRQLKHVTASDFSGMRVLKEEDKSGNVNTSEHSSRQPELLPLSAADYRNLELFRIQPSTEIRGLEGIIARLQETETFHIFQALVKSFPCAPCLLDKAPSAVAPAPRKKRFLASDLPNSFTNTLFGQRLGRWRITFSEKAFRDMRSSDKIVHFTAIVNKLRELASGYWDTNSLRRPLSRKMIEEAKAKQRVPLWRAVYASDGRILWQVNVGFDEDFDDDWQEIVVWRIGSNGEVRKSVRDVLKFQQSYTPAQIRERKVSFNEFPVLPNQCSKDQPPPDIDRGENSDDSDSGENPDDSDTDMGSESFNDGNATDGTSLEAQETLMTSKFYCATSKVLDRLFTSSNLLEFPFDISREETEIIKHANTAAFIQGRSGTGKTTCLLFKLLCRNIASRENEDTSVRQIFVTRSSFLAERLAHYLGRLMKSQIGDLSTPEVESEEPQSQEYTLKEAQDPLEGLGLDNLDDSRFPLVCTFEQLFNFLERATKFNTRNDFSVFEREGSNPATTVGRVARRIDYDVFSTQYWCKRLYNQKNGFEPELVFSEFIGTIKGSTSAHRGFKPLSREDYVELGSRRAPVFTDHASRTAIYDMYQEYERRKRFFGDQDDVDRVTELLKSLEDDPDLKKRVQSLFDEVYVDEIQDNRLLELDLILTLVRNPNGIHFAGDTAQCISRDNTFRFQDIKARFYEHFVAMAEVARKRSWARPELFKLAKNYRSHQGILSLAADIVDMLCNGFPGQVDSLPREVGTEPGTKPTVFVGFNHEILGEGRVGILGAEEGLSCFGAEQVIIVRDDAAKEELQRELRRTLILTVFQSKGLEFDDVVLYNFFTGSTVWRNVGIRTLKLLLNKNVAYTFDTRAYGMLCSELKHLYVAVTRARKNLWIVESDRASVHSILTIWERTEENLPEYPLVTVLDVEDPDAAAAVKDIIKPARSTSPEAWRSQGEMFLHRSLYKEALICFKKARHNQGEALATAHIRYQEARAKDVDVKEVRREARVLYEQAANLFHQAGFIQKAAESWAATRKYRKAADILRDHGAYGRAAPFYEEAHNFLEAATCYDKAEQYDNALMAYRKGDHFQELVDYLRENENRISRGLRTCYLTLVNILLQRGDIALPERMHFIVVDMLGNDSDKEAFYQKFNRAEDLWKFYIEKRLYYKAFKLALTEGKFEDAIRLAQEPRAVKAGVISAVPECEVLTLFNGLMAAHAWSSMGISFNEVSQRNGVPPMSSISSLRKITLPILRGPHLGWEQISDCIFETGAKLNLIRPLDNRSSQMFLQGCGNDFLDLAELIRLDKHSDSLSEVKDFTEVPIATLSKFAAALGDMMRNKAPPANLLTCVGALLLTIDDPDADQGRQAIVLSWSPLFPATAQSDSSEDCEIRRRHVFMTVEQVHHAFTSWLTKIASRIIPLCLEQMRKMMHSRKDPCFHYLQSGECKHLNEPDHVTSYQHTRLPSEETKHYIMALLDVTGLACSSLHLYYNRKLKENDSKGFQGLKRVFFEMLMKELTFISPLLNDTTVQHEVWDMILAKDGRWLHVRDGMASLFLFRLRPQKSEQRSTLSAVLEESDLARKLGVMWRLEKFVKQNESTGRDQDTTLALLKDLERLQPHNISKFTNDELRYCAFKWTTFIAGLDFSELQSFHSILSLFELLSLELMNRATSLDFLVPKSRLQFARQDVSRTPALNATERRDIESVLMEVLHRLCEILSCFALEYQKRQSKMIHVKQNNIEFGKHEHPEALFEACGHRLWNGNKFMIRRSMDHLALCMVNLGLGRFPPPEYRDSLWKRIVEIYSQWTTLGLKPTLVRWRSILNHSRQELATQLVDTYKV